MFNLTQQLDICRNRKCNGICTVTQERVKKAWIIHVYSHSANSSFFDGLCPGRSSLLNTNSPRQLRLTLLHTVRMMSSLSIADRAGGSGLPSAVKT